MGWCNPGAGEWKGPSRIPLTLHAGYGFPSPDGAVTYAARRRNPGTRDYGSWVAASAPRSNAAWS